MDEFLYGRSRNFYNKWKKNILKFEKIITFEKKIWGREIIIYLFIYFISINLYLKKNTYSMSGNDR